MKIGVATITEGANYGNKLQNYAMLKMFDSLGYEAENVKKICDNEKSLKTKLKRFVIKTLRVKNHIKVTCQDKFARFNKKHLKFSNNVYSSADFNCDDYKAIVCGSDQIWNFNFATTHKDLDYYFAGFAPQNKRMAFSASIGVDYIEEKYHKTFIDYINKMAHISVRENQAAKIIKDLTGRDVAVTVDPTLMLTADEWLKLAKKPKFIKNDNFIVTYFLGDSSDTDNYIDNVAKANNCQVIKLQNHYIDNEKIINPQWFCADPCEFVWLFANAKAVITDSFHGCVFATIFKKPFRWFSRSTDSINISMNSRMDTLFSKLGIGDWCIGNINESADDVFNCDFSSVDENLAKEREFAYNYLKEALK